MEKNSKIIIIVLAIVCLGLGGTVGYLVLNDSQEKCTSKVPETDTKVEEEAEEDDYTEEDYYEEEKTIDISAVKKYTADDIKYVYLYIPCQDNACQDPVSHQIVICDKKEITELLKVFSNLEEKKQGLETGLISAYAMEFVNSKDEIIRVVLADEDIVWINSIEYKLQNASDYFYSFDGKTLTK